MTTPTLDDLQPGRLLYVPAGAALARQRPFSLIISEATASTGMPSDVWLGGQVLRADGSNPLRYRTTWFLATVAKLTIAPPGIRRCVAAGGTSYDVIAMHGGEPIVPGWRMLQRGILGGTNLCPRHAPTATPDGATHLHVPEAMDRNTGVITCTFGISIRPRMARKKDTPVRGACVLAYGVHIAAMTPRRPS
ncbi:hypothetical protein [Nonomuraea sp. SYSU D8015]|uniref:hypothetical protein n=1 Tax=Nonomuraea sp. SYSU D8015 TaxID=2593644 RepID=UPI0016607FE8|nr:hypothetical protein [Nonomuraea sp. SYSU D8015]